MHTVKAARLLGARVILAGISRPVSHTLAEIGTELDAVTTSTDLQGGIEEASRRLQTAR
jgi:rsbT co-antagonist protein RsbR